MQHQSLLQLLAGDEEFRQIADGLKNRLQHQAVFGLAGSQKHFWWAGLASRQENLQFLIISLDDLSAGRIVDDLSTFAGKRTCFFPRTGIPSLPDLCPEQGDLQPKNRGLDQAGRNRPRIIVTTGEAFAKS